MAGPDVYLNDVLVPTARIRQRTLGDTGIAGLTSTANGSGGQGAITFEDETHDFDDDVQGWTPVKVNEPACTTAPGIFRGYVAGQTYDRGPHYRDDGKRQIDVTINDLNVLLAMDVFQGTEGKRPQEDEIARMNWLLGTDQLGGLVQDLGLINTSSGIVLDATDYVDQSPVDVLNDMLARRADNVFGVYYSNDDDAFGLFYDSASATSYTCSLSFSNLMSEVDDTDTFYAYLDPSVDSEPAEVYCEVIFKWSGGTTVRHSDTTHDTYFAWLPAGMHRTKVEENSHVGKASTANNWANYLLAHYSIEDRLVKFHSRLPAEVIGLIQPAMRVNLHFLHLPELDPAEYRRIESLTVYPTEGRRDFYDIEVEASKFGLRIPGGSGSGSGGSTTPAPHQPPTGTYSETFPVIGDETWVPNSPYGLLSGLQTCALGTTVLVPGDTYDYDVTAVWLHGAYARGAVVEEDNLTGLPHTIALSFNSTNWPDAIDGTFHDTGSFTVDVGAPSGANWRFRGGTAQTPHGHDIMGYITFRIGPTGTLTDTGPGPLQWVRGEVVTMSGADGTTAFGYQPGSLTVWVNRVPISSASITEIDPVAGTFTLAWSPDTDEVVTVDYQGHS